MNLTIINKSKRPVPRVFLSKWVRELNRLAAKKINPDRYRGQELVVVFLGEKEARQLNKNYRGKDYATDVLSFSSEDPSCLGELVICPEVISRQAREHEIRVREELGYMILHGFLHLLGYEHERSPSAAKRMFAIQEQLFDQLLERI